MAEDLYTGLFKYKLGKRYDVAKHANDSKLNEGRDYTNDLMTKGLSSHITRTTTMQDFVRFMQDLFVNSVKTVTQLKLYKAFAIPKDYLKVK